MKIEVVTGFTAQRVHIHRQGLRPMIMGAQIRFEWDMEKEEYVSTGLGHKVSYTYLPKNGDLMYSLMLGYKCRLLVRTTTEVLEFEDEEFELDDIPSDDFFE